MLIIKWADPSHLPCFLVRQSKTEKIINEVSKDHKLRNLPSAVRHQFSKMIVEGLLNQLQSAPTEMMAIEICYELCPGLRGVQEEAVEVNLREMTASLSTQIRDRTPSEVFRKNAAMNAAFCLEWAERSGDRTPVIPFETLGFLSKGQELLTAYRAVPVESRERYILTVDSWAKILSLHGWYEWQFRDEVNKRGTDSL